ncbi:MAG: nicotinamide-nucleotide amidohydrolase family protein [Ruminococcaceae bacterium]|nr:nicotinamide-nucleotide amidohydrolase family protein [Oscillospiraceae bacterium]
MTDIRTKAERLLSLFREKKLTLAAAESCTGGLINAILTAVPGSSDVVLGGVVSYSNSVKERALGVKSETLISCGAVSENTAREMAIGVRRLCGSDIAVSVTGIAGPRGGTEEKPVGTVCFGVCSSLGCSSTVARFDSTLSRDEIRALSCIYALELAAAEAEKLK